MNIVPKIDFRRLGASLSAALAAPAKGAAQLLGDQHAPRSTWVTQAPSGASANRSIRRSGLWRTARAVNDDRELAAASSGLRTYLAILLRSHARAATAYEMVVEAIDEGHRKSLPFPPGPRPRLYQLARRIAQMDDVFDAESGSVVDAPWEPAPVGHAVGYGALLERVRGLVSATELETVLLSITLGLPDAEIAFILDDEEAAVTRRLTTTRAWIALQLDGESAARNVAPHEVLADALRVLPPPALSSTGSAAPSTLPPGTVLASRYELEAPIGGGAFGHVYRARDRRVHTHVVAIKLAHRPALTAAAKDGALAELSRIASAFHPNLVQLKEHGWHEDRLWFAMPFYEGETLAERIERAPLDLPEAARLLAPIADALDALRSAGIRHQDVKPDNIFLVRMGDTTLPVLLDLGVAARSDEVAVAGTPMFFSPEVARKLIAPDDVVAIDDRADVFALAMTFVQCLEGPHSGDEPELEAFLQERAERPPSVEHVALGKERSAVLRWLSKEPGARPSAAQLAAELRGIATQQSRGTTPRGRVAWLALAALAAMAGAFAGWSAHAGGESPRHPIAEEPARSSVLDRVEMAALRERLETAESRANDLEERASACEPIP